MHAAALLFRGTGHCLGRSLWFPSPIVFHLVRAVYHPNFSSVYLKTGVLICLREMFVSRSFSKQTAVFQPKCTLDCGGAVEWQLACQAYELDFQIIYFIGRSEGQVLRHRPDFVSGRGYQSEHSLFFWCLSANLGTVPGYGHLLQRYYSGTI